MRVLDSIKKWWGYQMKMLYLQRLKREEYRFQRYMEREGNEIDFEFIDTINRRIKRLTTRQLKNGIN